ncbi:hypothetical protein [uncultured Roseobacter sp.]|uniref:hypothetical protein n=1 Tax=uncultured Roseobacter sp. TaxID=114847 RepID=UPI002609FA88|nr:hypothetical protein [uncultured Roseobacter sp.]
MYERLLDNTCGDSSSSAMSVKLEPIIPTKLPHPDLAEKPIRTPNLNSGGHMIEHICCLLRRRPNLDAFCQPQRHFPAKQACATSGVDIERRDRDNPPALANEVPTERAIATA